MNRKTLFCLSLLTPLTSAWLVAGPLDRARVAADAKWVVHLDVEQLLETQSGTFLAKRLLDARFAEGATKLKAELGVDFNWRRIHGLTLYGRDYRAPRRAMGVLVIDTDLDVRGGLEAALRKQKEAGYGEDGPVIPLVKGGTALYSLNDKAYVALAPGRPVVIGQSRAQVEEAREVLLGTRDSLTAGGAALETPGAPGSFFLVAAAKGFASEAPIPPQAQVLRMADGLQATLAEQGDNLLLNLRLLTRDARVSEQVAQVIQGLKALVALGQVDNQELKDLSQMVNVSASGRNADLHLRIPIEKIQQRIRQQAEEEGW
ncbi:MAG: hypothetical protein H7A45_02840 [Verrucomicrobiales bacterium]|nr:hypothetical protein [Verrucomicrobiales bacterium]MCP5528597.1 hypothetical protein [Verrucomicrobiales bacterium]